jgi:hypothetical protein
VRPQSRMREAGPWLMVRLMGGSDKFRLTRHTYRQHFPMRNTANTLAECEQPITQETIADIASVSTQRSCKSNLKAIASVTAHEYGHDAYRARADVNAASERARGNEYGARQGGPGRYVRGDDVCHAHEGAHDPLAREGARVHDVR